MVEVTQQQQCSVSLEAKLCRNEPYPCRADGRKSSVSIGRRFRGKRPLKHKRAASPSCRQILAIRPRLRLRQGLPPRGSKTDALPQITTLSDAPTSLTASFLVAPNWRRGNSKKRQLYVRRTHGHERTDGRRCQRSDDNFTWATTPGI